MHGSTDGVGSQFGAIKLSRLRKLVIANLHEASAVYWMMVKNGKRLNRRSRNCPVYRRMQLWMRCFLRQSTTPGLMVSASLIRWENLGSIPPYIGWCELCSKWWRLLHLQVPANTSVDNSVHAIPGFFMAGVLQNHFCNLRTCMLAQVTGIKRCLNQLDTKGGSI